LQVREGLRGVKPLANKDRVDLGKTIDENILGGRPIAFRSTAVEPGNGELTVHGELEQWASSSVLQRVKLLNHNDDRPLVMTSPS
jgi:hypothetical protein